jgi:pyridoxal phosphate-dependent aminotransferase EpsN
MSRYRNRQLLLLDAGALIATPFLLFALRFDGWTAARFQTAWVFAIASAVVTAVASYRLGLYRRLWRYASVTEVVLIAKAGAIAGVTNLVLGALVLPLLHATPARVPISVLFTYMLATVLILAAPRLGVRVLARKQGRRHQAPHGHRVLIAGAGSAGRVLLDELLANPQLGLRPIGFVDDDPQKQQMRLSDLPVLGPLSHTADAIARHQIDEVVIAMPTAPGSIVRPVVRAALDAGARARTIPGLFEILSGDVRVGSLRQVEIHDLLRREPIRTNLQDVGELVSGRTVLVTGAGGSIGSELCRQIASLDPARLVLLGHGENPIFHIKNELRALFPDIELVAVIADIRDRARIRRVFAQQRPFAVFHAAAHKHVPLMEENVMEAVTNNIRGTHNVVNAAGEFGTQHFVLVSTDKAVRPTSVMGATKRIAEHIVQAAAEKYQRNFVSVRFGNVLGSEGSVVPTFVSQIKKGGPVTVTHPEVRRFFMTIPEAVQLILQAGAMGSGAELFMLDMGEPIKIADLAADLIRLSGFEPNIDIQIEFTGMRPGEKLYEEMFWKDESATPTEHPKVLCARSVVIDEWKTPLIQDLLELASAGAEEEQLRHGLKLIVPDFQREDVEARQLPTPTEVVAAVPPADHDGSPSSEPSEARRLEHIYLSSPHLSGEEEIMVSRAIRSNWIAPLGPNVDAFQSEFAELVGAKHAIALSSGTAAIHLALLLEGVGPGDEVFVSTLTFSASVNPICYLGAKPVFIDSERESWNMDPQLLEHALEERSRSGKLPKAVIVVHLYGQSANLKPILETCARYGVPVIEDAAEALGASYGSATPGTFGRAGIFSFNGNKIITTSGGGMLVSEDGDFIAEALKLSTQARDRAPHYQHSTIGYNYRMSNVLAAIGRAQLRVLDERVAARRRNFAFYRRALRDMPGVEFTPQARWGRHTRWLTTLTIDPKLFGADREQIRLALEQESIESRPVWKPMHQQPVFSRYESYGGEVAGDLFARGLCLPSGSNLTERHLQRVVDAIRRVHARPTRRSAVVSWSQEVRAAVQRRPTARSARY